MRNPVVSQIPRGVGAPPPPGMDPRKGKGKLMCIKVRLLDESVAVFHLGHKATGQALFDETIKHLNLLESDYFGLEFVDGYGNRCWLDKDKSILRQITSSQSDARFYFVVKFYTPNPADLEEEYTRYLMSLQIRRDLAQGELICNEATAALLVSYIVQAECGDFSPVDYPDHTYLSATAFVPNQTAAFQIKVMDLHRTLIGMTPAQADMALLDTARRCDFYGVRLHNAKDVTGTDVGLSVAHMGIKVFHQHHCNYFFSWAKIKKISFKRKRLMIAVHPDNYSHSAETTEFSFENRDDCKNFWKKCVEHHSFFRCLEPLKPKKESRLFSRGSSFRYQGRTQKQLIDYVREHRKRREPFQRPLRSSHREASAASSLGGHLSTTAFIVSDRVRQNPSSMYDAQPTLSHATKSQVTFPSITCQSTAYNNQQQRNTEVHYAELNIKNNNNGILANGHSESHAKTAAKENGRQKTRGNFLNELETVISARSNGNVDYNANSTHQQELAHYGANHHQRQQSSIEETGVALRNGHMNTNGCIDQDSYDYNKDATGANIYQYQNPDYHQEQDLMSTSLPNVLAKDIRVMCGGGRAELEVVKSASGDNFMLDQICGGGAGTVVSENLSETGSYKLGSSQSDVVGPTPTGAASIDQRVYSTTFTTKRVGNVIVKKVTDQKTKSGSASTKNGSGGMVGGSLYDAEDSASSSHSDVCVASTTSAPVAATNSNRSRLVTRERYITGLSQLRDQTPVPIDGPLPPPPPMNSQSIGSLRSSTDQSDQDTASSKGPPGIIRPVVISGRSKKLTTTPTSEQTVLRRPVVVKTGQQLAKETSQSPRELFFAGKMDKGASEPTDEICSQNQPLSGRVISKQNLVITPTGIGVKAVGQQLKPKPKVPPKPVITNLFKHEPSASTTAFDEAESAHRAKLLLDPLDSILNDIQKMDKALSEVDLTKTHQKSNKVPIAVAEDSEVRSCNTSAMKIADTITTQVLSEIEMTGMLRPTSKRTADIGRRHVSLNLTNPVCCLPTSHSQEHSSAPSTSTDQISSHRSEQTLRRRSLNNEQQQEPKLTTSSGNETVSKRAERRLTQPVQASTLSKAVKSLNKGNKSLPAEGTGHEQESIHSETTKPENCIMTTKVNAEVNEEAKETGIKVVKGLLETDF